MGKTTKNTASKNAKVISRNKNTHSGSAASIFIALIGCAVIIVPLIVRLVIIQTTTEDYAIFNQELLGDFFSYSKSVTFIIVTVLIWLIFIAATATGEIKPIIKHPIVIAALVYSASVILSALLSKYSATSLRGSIERYEGVFVLLGYMTVLLTVMFTCKGKERIYLWIFAVSAFAVGIIGVINTFFKHPFATEFGLRLIMGKYYGEYVFSIVHEKACSTLYNPNYLGLFSASLLPLFCFTAFYLKRNDVLKYISALVSVLLLICLYGAASSAGYLALIATVFMGVLIISIYYLWSVFPRKTTPKDGIRKKHPYTIKKVYLYTAGSLIFILFVVSIVNFDAIKQRLLYEFNVDGRKYPQAVTDMRFNGTDAVFTVYGGQITVTVLNNEFFVKDKLPDLFEQGVSGESASSAQYNMDGYRVELTYAENRCLAVIAGRSFLLGVRPNGNIAILTANGEFIDLSKKIPSFGFKGRENFASGRGFIWSRSIPMALSFFGGGPDSFIYEFPNHDVMGKLYGMGDIYQVVDKPHNMYLQISSNTGLISLLAVLFIFGYYVVSCFRNIVDASADSNAIEPSNSKFLFALRCGIFLGIFAFLVCSFSTDSSVSVTPVFYAMLGFGLGINENA